MCNLYSMTCNREAILRLFRISHNRAASFEPQAEIYPGRTAPVIRKAADGERELSLMSWGFPLQQPGRAAKRVTNARQDRVLDSPFWRSSFESRRCLVPATSFAEPKGQRPAVWHWFGRDDTLAPFAFAGIWRRWRGKLKPAGEPQDLEVFAILTTLPDEVVAPINPTRMPVLLFDEKDQQTWLDGTQTAIQEFLSEKPCVGPKRVTVRSHDND